jgi:RNA ligase
VVDYGDRAELVLLAVIDTETGDELPLVDFWGFKTAKHYDGIATLTELAQSQLSNFEGYVVRFASGLRVKVKLGEYVRLHKLITGINEGFVLDALINGDDLAKLTENVPDEFNTWLKATVDKLQACFNEIEDAATNVFRSTTATTRKEYAEAFKQTPYVSILFAMLDGKNHGKIIWRMVADTIKVSDAPLRVDVDA